MELRCWVDSAGTLFLGRKGGFDFTPFSDTLGLLVGPRLLRLEKSDALVRTLDFLPIGTESALKEGM